MTDNNTMNTNPSTENDIFLSMQHITKEFPGVRALNDVTFEVRRGEVHALVGENGAGKSTLMKILAGAEHPTSGRIFIDGEEVLANSPVKAQRMGISIIYQEFNLVPGLSAAENIFLGRFPRKSGTRFVDFAKMHAGAAELLERIGMDLDPHTLVSELSVAEQQMVEIAKALSIDSKLIVMDEPSATLTEREIERLFEIIHTLVEQGVTTVYISHRLEEIFSISNRVTVMRDGEVVGTRLIQDITKDELIGMMVGRKLAEIDISRDVQKGKEALRVEGLATRDGKVRDVSFTLYEGEILGIYGLVGAGRTETAGAVFGIERPAAGRMWVYGGERWFLSPRQALRSGVGLLPEDRKQHGLVLPMTVRENTTLGALRRFTKFLFVRSAAERRIATDLIDRLSIRTYGMEQEAMTLSGGNQQKVVLAKVLCAQSKVLIFDEPTRGVDVGAKAEIYQLMADQVRKEGAAVLMISSELPEILGVADRILVMRDGRINGEFTREEATEEKVIRAALGAQS